MAEIPKCGICGVTGGCPCHPGMTYPTPPTLTCSEVVERLQLECVEPCKVQSPLHPDALDWHYSKLNPEKAAAILHSWRERRVRELEQRLRGMLTESIVLTKEYLETVASGKQDWESVQGWDIARWKRLLVAKESAEKVLANSEWREQIRKGARHESA